MAVNKLEADSITQTSEFVDCLCIGTSIIASLEACYQSQLGKNVLMIDRDDSFGGAWKTVEIGGIKDVENAIHYFLPDNKGLDYLRNVLNWPIEVSKGKYRYFNVFGNTYIKFSYRSPIGRFIYKFFYSKRPPGLLGAVFHLIRSVKLVLGELGERSYYVSKGSAFMLESVKTMLHKHEVEIRLNSNITNLFFDMANKTVHCSIGDQIIIAKSLILGHGARLPKIESSNGHFEVRESFNPRPAFHLVVSDDKKNEAVEVIITADPVIKYVHDISRFSSLGQDNTENKKVFVFALQSDVKNDRDLSATLLKTLKDLGVIGSRAEIISSLYSDIILPTLSDQDLYLLKAEFGDLVNILRTENFAAGVGYYSDIWGAIK